MHGGTYLALKAAEPVAGRAAFFAGRAAVALMVLFALAGLWVAIGVDGYAITSTVAHDGPANPLFKQVARHAGGWIANYGLYPWTIAAPALAFAGAALTIPLLRSRRNVLALVVSAMSVASVIATAGLSAFAWNWESFGVLRFVVGLAMGSEWATGTAMTAELWPDQPR